MKFEAFKSYTQSISTEAFTGLVEKLLENRNPFVSKTLKRRFRGVRKEINNLSLEDKLWVARRMTVTKNDMQKTIEFVKSPKFSAKKPGGKPTFYKKVKLYSGLSEEAFLLWISNYGSWSSVPYEESDEEYSRSDHALFIALDAGIKQ